jgi:glycosyltransferase involved in cell wall biosynthesis
MKIAIVTQSLQTVGGAENVVIWLAKSLAERGHAVSILALDFSEDVWGKVGDQPFSVLTLKVKRKRSSSTWKANREAGKALANGLSRRAFDVVNAHNYPASLWVHYAKQKSTGFPGTVLFLHNLPGYFYEDIVGPHIRELPGFRNAWNRIRPKRVFRKFRQHLFGYMELDKASVRSFDEVIANSEYTAALARKIYSREVEPCVLGVRLENVPWGAASDGMKSAPLPEDPPVVLTVARIELQKNFDTLVEAIRILKANRDAPGRRFRYLVAGGGPHLEHFKAKSRRLGIGDVVTFTGSVPHHRIRELFEKASFLVHIPLDEPFGLVPVEAALCAKTSIVSDHGGPAEVVVDGVTGIHVDALDPASVAEKIGYLLDHPEEARKMGERARSRVVDHYSWDRFIDHFEHHLRQACAPLP